MTMFNLADTVQMKKPHACGANKWEVLRLGADIRIKCMGCGHLVMMPHAEFSKKMKKVLTWAKDPANRKLEHYVAQEDIVIPNMKK